MTQSKDIARAMYESHVGGEDWPLPSQAIEGLDAATAYEIQREFVAQRLVADEIAGFKAGATAAPAQQALGLEAPFTGVLFASGRRANGASIAATGFRRLVLEAELCFRIGRAIGQRLHDADALREYVDGCSPAIELADVGGYGAAKFTGPDLIAGNGASAAYLLGPESDWRSPGIDELEVMFHEELIDQVPPIEEQGIPPEEITIAELLAEHGYHNVMLGKWHLGSAEGKRPHEQGFDEALGFLSGGQLYGDPEDPAIVSVIQDFDPIDQFLWKVLPFAMRMNDGPRFTPSDYMTDYLSAEAVKAIEANRHRPFFLYLAYNAPHTPLQAKKADYEALSHIESDAGASTRR